MCIRDRRVCRVSSCMRQNISGMYLFSEDAYVDDNSFIALLPSPAQSSRVPQAPAEIHIARWHLVERAINVQKHTIIHARKTIERTTQHKNTVYFMRSKRARYQDEIVPLRPLQLSTLTNPLLPPSPAARTLPPPRMLAHRRGGGCFPGCRVACQASPRGRTYLAGDQSTPTADIA